MKTIYFDMDGTIAALFFIKNYSKRLASGDMNVYRECKPLFNENELKSVINNLKNKGYDIGIISYIDNEYTAEAINAKKDWLNKFFPYATENKIHIVTRDIDKTAFYNNGDILIDDAKKNQAEWTNIGGVAINGYFRAPINWINVLKTL